MCGISGFIGDGDQEILNNMGKTLTHRGPDDRGSFFIPGEIGFDFRRLSIIDLAHGNQPLQNEDGSVVSVFNGEIYNFQDLRKQLSVKHQLKTLGDAEVIPHLYEDHGTKLFEFLNGMFAVAIWDRRRKRLVLARDRLGKKPLYYCISQNTLVFGSEIKALLCHPLVKRALDPQAVFLYLTHEYIPSPLSPFRGIRKIMPGHFAIFENGTFREEEYYAPKFFTCELPSGESELIKIFDGELRRAVSDRLVSEVPLGLFLSGGLDSSTICYYARELSPSRLKTFSIAFSDPEFDESNYAQIVAKHLGTDHHAHEVTPNILLDAFYQLTGLLDEPTGDAAIFPNYLLSRFAKKQVTVALGGDGGDELLMGYPTFQAHRLATFYEKIPMLLRRGLIEPFIRKLPPSYGHIGIDYKLKRFVSGLQHPQEHRDLIWIGSFTPQEKRELLTPEFLELVGEFSDFNAIDRYKLPHLNHDPLHQIAHQYQRTYLTDDILFIKDRASMAVSLELRSPLLDFRVVDFINSLPASMKLKRLTVKYLLKNLMRGRLPDKILDRPKKGFGVPIGKWLKNELRPLLLDSFNEVKIKNEGIFRIEKINALMNDHFTGKKDNRKELWTLLMLQVWKKNWLAPAQS